MPEPGHVDFGDVGRDMIGYRRMLLSGANAGILPNSLANGSERQQSWAANPWRKRRTNSTHRNEYVSRPILGNAIRFGINNCLVIFVAAIFKGPDEAPIGAVSWHPPYARNILDEDLAGQKLSYDLRERPQ
jgi:hypothetical protein